MRTLNKTLALVLALVMVLGMFGVATAADFTDDETIQYKEAVGVMTGIGAINGMDDGTFAPAGNVTRAQAAKMVAYAVLGENVAKTLPVSASSFTDVDANFAWAIPSIEYLVGEGVINGRGDGTFDPNGNITAYEIAKMLLCAAGYGKNGEFVGPSWALNVAIVAQKNGVFTGTKATDLNAAATREESALYCFNVLTTVDKVVYDKTTESYVDDTTTTTLADEVYEMQAVVEGVITANQTNSANKFTTVGGADYNIETGLDLVGHFVRVYYKSTYTSATVPGVTYAVVDLSTKVDVAKNIATTSAWNTAFGTGTITNTLAAGTNLFTNYTAGTGAVGGLNIATKTADAGTYILYKSDIKTYIAPATYTVDVVAAYTAPTATATGKIDFAGATDDIIVPKTGDTTSATALKYAAYSVYETPAAKDVVCVQAAGALTAITKATVATGTVSAVSVVPGSESIKIDGTTYAKSAAFVTPTGFAAFTSAALLNNSCTVFLDNAGAVVAALVNSTAADAGLAYVVDAYYETVTGSYGAVTTLVKVQCVDMNGEEVNYLYGVETDTAAKTVLLAADLLAGSLYSVETTYDSTLKADVASFTLASTLATQGKTTNTVDAEKTAIKTSDVSIETNNYYDADTVFLFVENTGANLKVTKATGVQATGVSDEYSYYSTKATAAATNYTVKYVVVAGAPVATAEQSLMFVPADFNLGTAVSYTTAAGTPGTAYKNVAFIDGAPKLDVLTLSKNDSKGDPIVKGGFYNFTKAANGIYTLTPATTGWGLGTVANVYSNFVSFGGFVMPTDFAGYPGTPVSYADMDATGAYIVDVIYLSDMLLNGGANELTQITSLNGLMKAAEETTNAKIMFTWKTNASGAPVFTGIYVVQQPA